MSAATLREIVTDAVRYWELRRIAYNLVLAGITAAIFVAGWPDSGEAVQMYPGNSLLALFVLAVLANIAYCSAYAVDIMMQYSEYRPYWLQFRWMLFLLGLLFACSLALWFSLWLFQPFSMPY
jgi:hypothetical protein